ncbi:MAG: non-heme iron oxygenase ferredoxin subunit [Gemmatimonadetes bacterium]|nr:non-heme iron oxygenase ferredoxin subunit [Gemmatimonadota bacterium]
MANWVRVIEARKVKQGELRGVSVEKVPVVLANVEGSIYALRDECSHEDYPLSDGEIEGDEIVCLYHGAAFECATGKNTALPAVRPVTSYPVEVRDGEIFVDVG